MNIREAAVLLRQRAVTIAVEAPKTSGDLMSAQSSIPLVLENAEKARDQAIAVFEGGKRAYEAAKQLAQSLTDQRHKYQSKWQTQFRQTGDMEIARCYQNFIEQLAEALADQDKHVENARLYMGRCREQMTECERKVTTVAQLIERRHLCDKEYLPGEVISLI